MFSFILDFAASIYTVILCRLHRIFCGLLYTKHSLPIPFISAVDPKMASRLASYGFDMANLVTVGKQASYAILINSLIAMIHGLFYDGDNSLMSRKLYEVRTRKILSYSNLIASSSNIAVVAITQNFELLDIGGLAATIYRLITDQAFIQKDLLIKVKCEFENNSDFCCREK